MEKNRKSEDRTSNKVLAVFVFGAIWLWLVSYLIKAFDIPTSYHTASIIAYVLLAVSVGVIIYGILKHRADKKTASDGVFSGSMLSLFGAIAAVCCLSLLIDYFFAMRFVYVFVPAVVVYYLIYNVYHRSFFFIAVTHGIAALLLFVAYKAPSLKYIAAIVGIILCALAIITVKLTSKSGVLKLGKCSVRIFESDEPLSFNASLILYGLTAALFIASLLLPHAFVIYLFYAVIAFIFCCAVYFTFRLI